MKNMVLGDLPQGHQGTELGSGCCLTLKSVFFLTSWIALLGVGGSVHPATFPRSLGVNLRSPTNHRCPVYTANYCPRDIGHSHASARGPQPPQQVPFSPDWAI